MESFGTMTKKWPLSIIKTLLSSYKCYLASFTVGPPRNESVCDANNIPTGKASSSLSLVFLYISRDYEILNIFTLLLHIAQDIG